MDARDEAAAEEGDVQPLRQDGSIIHLVIFDLEVW
jgi:hypothetical protein